MTIKIKTDGKKIFIPIPVTWAFGRIGLNYLKKHDEDGSFSNVTPKTMKNIRKTIRKMKRIHKKWNLVEVESNDGTSVRIRL
jgi:hypothetical protein